MHAKFVIHNYHMVLISGQNFGFLTKKWKFFIDETAFTTSDLCQIHSLWDKRPPPKFKENRYAARYFYFYLVNVKLWKLKKIITSDWLIIGCSNLAWILRVLRASIYEFIIWIGHLACIGVLGKNFSKTVNQFVTYFWSLHF